MTERDQGQAAVRSFIDTTLDRGTADPSDDLAAIMTPANTLTGAGARAGYPQLTVPAGYTSTQRRPVNISFNGTAYSEQTLLALGYAYEQATKLQRPPSVVNPALYRCADTKPPSVYGAHSCAPGLELLKRVGREPRLPFSLEQTSTDDLQRRMARGRLSSTTLTKAYLARIARTNTAGPSINAVRIVNRHALDDARALDRERARGRVRGAMHGIPVLVKDNIDVRGMPTTAGAVALEHSYPRDDAPIVKTLRRAGAIILGKTNLSEFANFYSSNSISGYSGLGGQVLTPIDLDQNPSGSSSGSAAAASAGLAAATIGTETSGSIVSPAARHGIVGLRPTVGLVPRTGIVPISASQDTAGPMTQTVYDAAAELQAIAGRDAEDPATDSQPAVLPDYLSGLKADALAGTRIGVITSNDTVYQAAVAAVQAAGAVTVPIPTPSASAGPSILTLEFERDLNAYFARLPADAPIKSLTEVIAFNDAHPDETIKLGQDILIAAEAIDLSDPATYQAYVTARDNGRAVTRAAIDTALTRGTDGHGRRPGGDNDPGRDADRPRRARRVPAAHGARRLRRYGPQPGEHLVQRHALQRADAARPRPRVRAGDARAPAAERDQPGLVAVRTRQRDAAAVLPARRSAAAEGVGPRAPLTGPQRTCESRIVIVAWRNLPRVAGRSGS